MFTRMVKLSCILMLSGIQCLLVNDSNSLHLLSPVKIVYAMAIREFTAYEKTYPEHSYGQSIDFKVIFLKFI